MITRSWPARATSPRCWHCLRRGCARWWSTPTTPGRSPGITSPPSTATATWSPSPAVTHPSSAITWSTSATSWRTTARPSMPPGSGTWSRTAPFSITPSRASAWRPPWWWRRPQHPASPGGRAGGPAGGAPVVPGLSFRYAGYRLPPRASGRPSAACNLGAVIEADHARGVTFRDCAIEHTGTYGIWLRDGCRDCVIERCFSATWCRRRAPRQTVNGFLPRPR